MALAPSPEHPRSITVLGATGSIGRSTLSLVADNADCYRVEALTAQTRVDALAAAARAHGARLAVIGDPKLYAGLKDALAGSGVEAAAGPQALVDAAERPAEWVMAGIVGAAGLAPTLAAVRRGAMVALANKECLVCAGSLFIDEVRRSGAALLPVDSEHNAIFQALRGEDPDSVERLVLTASGGPFRTASLAQMSAATPEQAANHPKWSMGVKISIDSATLMNKGLELIEAHHLFAMPESAIDVVIHPQSTIHSVVRFRDGSCIAQLGQPDMRIPISYILGWPARIAADLPRLDLAEVGELTFEAPDDTRFPALTLARRALCAGDSAPTILNAANEVAVAAFIAREIGFLDIARVVEATMDAMESRPLADLDDVVRIDAQARREAAHLAGLSSPVTSHA